MNVLVTGGAGYIGSHAALRLLEDGHAVTVVDDLSRGNRGAVEVLEAAGDLRFAEGRIGDRDAVAALLRDRGVDLVMHFAAFTYVGESVEQPLRYWRNNLGETLALLEAMDDAGVSRFVQSSTAAVYGEPPPDRVPITEDCPTAPINPYGRSKLAVEEVLRDRLRAGGGRRGEPFAFAALRYFNVAGSDAGTRLGEDHDPETHLVPICLEAALGRREALTIFGTDYDTPDGTCVRDYVHVDDLVDAHLAAMDALRPGEGAAYNVGVGRGYSVREVVEAAHRVTGVDFPVREGPRRPGDPPTLYADPSRIRSALGWSARHTSLDEIIESAWRWRREHPEGYGEGEAAQRRSGAG